VTANDTDIKTAYAAAKERYAELGVDTDSAMKRLAAIPISLHCWQGDDVGGFENAGEELGGGLAVTGNYPGKARTPDELRSDLNQALALIPGSHRLNLHAFYGEFGGRRVDRNEIRPEHFQGWIDWAQSQKVGMDFNPTFFSHPKAADGFTLASTDKGIREFWIEHGIVCRQIGAAIGKALGSPCVTNVWIPDGYKDLPIDRRSPRERPQGYSTLARPAADRLARELRGLSCGRGSVPPALGIRYVAVHRGLYRQSGFFGDACPERAEAALRSAGWRLVARDGPISAFERG